MPCILYRVVTGSPLLKNISLPQLELMDTLIGVRLSSHAPKQQDAADGSVYPWRDPTVALYYIRGSWGRWKKFIANSGLDVKRLPDPYKWNHLSRKETTGDLFTPSEVSNRMVKEPCDGIDQDGYNCVSHNGRFLIRRRSTFMDGRKGEYA